jgi:predicted kinase
MATLILICGLPGAGKTTLAKQLERSRGAVRLTPDEWIAEILEDPLDLTELDRLRSPVESVQWGLAERLLGLGVDVILDWGFWSREERQEYRRRAEALGARVELYHLEVGHDELWSRVSERNAHLPPGTFRVTEEQLIQWGALFEVPTEEELGSDEG